MVKPLPAMWETWIRSLGWEDLLEEGMATHSSIQYSCLENPHGQMCLAGYSPWGRKESDTTGKLSAHTHTHTLRGCTVLESKDRAEALRKRNCRFNGYSVSTESPQKALTIIMETRP